MRVTKNTRKQLEEQGIRMLVHHERDALKLGEIDNRHDAPPTAATYVTLIKGSKDDVKAYKENPVGNRDKVVAKGQAFCGPKDQFTKRLGVQIALGRALDKIKFTEPLRLVL